MGTDMVRKSILDVWLIEILLLHRDRIYEEDQGGEIACEGNGQKVREGVEYIFWKSKNF